MANKAAATWRSVSGFLLPPLRLHQMSGASSQLCSSEQEKPIKISASRPDPSSTHDWIGPPNPLSNLRPIVYRISENESDLEKQLRKLRQETEDWNHVFWTRQNVNFSKDILESIMLLPADKLDGDADFIFQQNLEKEAFIISQLKAKGLTLRGEDGRRCSLSSEEMAVFYKSFLDKNRMRHADYNREWYRRNFTITLLMARIALNDFWRTVTAKYHKKKNSTPTI